MRGVDSISDSVFCVILLVANIHKAKGALRFEKLGGPVYGKWPILIIALVIVQVLSYFQDPRLISLRKCVDVTELGKTCQFHIKTLQLQEYYDSYIAYFSNGNPSRTKQ